MNKDEIINNYSNEEFYEFLIEDNNGKLLELLDQEGLSILDKSKNKKDRINYILTFSKYNNELFKNQKFLALFFKENISDYFDTFKNVKFDNQTYDIMIDICIKLNIDNDNIAQLFSCFNDEYKLKKLNNWPYEIDILYRLINISNSNIIECILNNYDIDLSDERINIETLIYKTKQSTLKAFEYRNMNNKTIPSISIPPYMLNKDLAKRLIKTYNIYKTRGLLDDLAYSSNTDLINDYIKKYEDYIINNTYEGDQSPLYKELSNYIIDYHFEENYHNIMIDIKELLRFYNDGNVDLQDEHVKLYKQIANIDYLSIDEKKQLHNNLKQINIKELFYDDMSLARYIVNKTIKEVSLTSKSLKKYKDESLSKKYGVNVYTINNEPFFGIVKTGWTTLDDLPTGHSYSLIGNDCVTVFKDENNYETFLYDAEDLNPKQIVHVFPFDSYTLYRPFNCEDYSTKRVHTLLMPEELTGLAANTYTELLILEQGKIQTDLDKKIPKLNKIALYCLDEIKEQDIELAQELDLGIILIKSKKFFEKRDHYEEKYKGVKGFDYNYYKYIYESSEGGLPKQTQIVKA